MKNFSARLAALEALEAMTTAVEQGRRLEVWLKMRPADYFTLFEAEPRDEEACAALEHAYGLDLIDWEADRVQVLGGTWPGVRRANEHTIARVEYDDGYGYWIDSVPWASQAEPGKPFWSIALDGDALPQLRREHALAGFDLVVVALGDGRMQVKPLGYGYLPDGTYCPVIYGLCHMDGPEVHHWGLEVDRLIPCGERPSTAEAYAQWITEHRLVLVDEWMRPRLAAQ